MRTKLKSNNYIIKYIKRNQGLTACQLYRLLELSYNNRSFSYGSKLYRLVQKGLITRKLELSATSSESTYRYYPIL